jgi:uncharacterized protein
MFPFIPVRSFGYTLLILLVALLVLCSVMTILGCNSREQGKSGAVTTIAESAGYDPLPGASPFQGTLLDAFERVRKERGKDYHPRTKWLRPDGLATYTNRLFLESSPYLLQHAHNPVNWFPWGDEAFRLAKKLNRPVLVSIGYSTCHWCHVMEEESFEDEGIARYLNENFIAIKIDREERPELDSIYMSAVQTLTGNGGWPLNVWLSPDRTPFHGGTYYSPGDLMKVLHMVKDAYAANPERIAQAGRQVTLTLKTSFPLNVRNELPTADVLHDAAQSYRQHFDGVHGGLQGAPKFPGTLPVKFLLRYQRRTGKNEFGKMAELTLSKMAAGGIYDQVGGGFHRYATDVSWLVPHFEKMLYDNALLAGTYLEGYQATGNKDFARITREILRYLQRDLSSPEGGFYAASDADSLTPNGHGEEGVFYTWSSQELTQILGKERAKVVAGYYGVTDQGDFAGRNILTLPPSATSRVENLNISQAQLNTVISESQDLLYRARSQRPQPLRDEKILTSWNGLVISAFARAGFILNDHRFVEQAVKSARFILENCYVKGKLFRSYKDGKGHGNGFLDDYSFMIAALLDLFEATSDPYWLKRAVELDDFVQRKFEDRSNGGCFMTGDDHETLLVREKPVSDDAVPSGNSVQLMNLFRLAKLTTKEQYRKRGEKALNCFSAALSSDPSAFSELLLAVDFYLDATKELIIVAPRGNKGAASSMLSAFRRQFQPNRIVVVVTEGEEQQAMATIIPLVRDKKVLDGKATAYLCENRICRLPVTDPEQLVKQIRKVEPLPATR